jgi:phosphoribosylformylglycinamidine cyclo-ligase
VSDKKLSYAASGVDYSTLDAIKRLAQEKAAGTAGLLEARGMSELPASRGESAYVWKQGDTHWAFVVEGLGTKNLVADEMRTVTGKTYYDAIAQDTVAMIVNDVIVVGARPTVINAYFAVGDSEWMADKERAADLINGWAKACEKSGAAWGGGETPTLKGIINPDTIDLGGSCIGQVPSPNQLVLGDRLVAGDVIVLVESNGIHSNGLTLARTIADQLPDRYATKLPNGELYGEALLQPTHLYAKLVEAVQDAGVDIHYMVNITGHGWRKLMRASGEFSYVMTECPEPQPLFTFIQEQAKADDKEMYGNFNMGVGFAIMAPAEAANKVVEAAQTQGLKAWLAGRVETGPKKVVIEPKNITFESEDLAVR